MLTNCPPNDQQLEGEQIVTHTQLGVFDLGPIVEEVRTCLSARMASLKGGKGLLDTAGVQAGLVNSVGNHYTEDARQSTSRDGSPEHQDGGMGTEEEEKKRAIGDMGETAREGGSYSCEVPEGWQGQGVENWGL